MSKNPPCVSFESLELRNYASVGIAGDESRSSTDSYFFMVDSSSRLDDRYFRYSNLDAIKATAVNSVLSERGTLLIKANDLDNSIRIRKTGKSTLQIAVTSTVAADTNLPEGRYSVLTQSVSSTESIVAGASLVTNVGDKTEITYIATIDTSAYKSIVVEGAGGHDVMRIDTPDLSVKSLGVERTVATQAPAPVGEKPWQPAEGTRGGSVQAWSEFVEQQIDAAATSNASMAFFGDSFVERFPHYGPRFWKTYFNAALNLGSSGESTRQLLARIDEGLFDNFKPETLVLLFGTNNFNDPKTSGTDAEIVRGIQAVIDRLKAKLPDTKLVFASILPRREPGLNQRIEAINQKVASLADNKRFFFVDAYNTFKGAPVRSDLYLANDSHLRNKGYRVLTSMLLNVLGEI